MPLTSAEKSARYRAKDVEAYRKKKREYARTPEERERRRLYQAKWREANREKYNEMARGYRRSRRDINCKMMRRWWLKKKFGITPEEYEKLLAAQSGNCALCGKPPKSKIRLHVDHDHKTGKIRKLLCVLCNTRLGWFEANRAAILQYVDMIW